MDITKVFALLPCVLWGANLVPVPSPLDESSKPLALKEGASFGQGKWVVQDTLDGSWFTKDAGAHWSAVPLNAGDMVQWSGILGDAYLDNEMTSYWTPDSGWKHMVFRGKTPVTSSTFIGTEGIRTFQAPDGATVDIFTSKDDLRSWDYQFSVARGNAAFSPWSVFPKFGKIWTAVADSAGLLGSADGQSWEKIPFPANFVFAFAYPESDDSVLSLIGVDSATQTDTVFVTTRNRGITWTRPTLDNPGSHPLNTKEGIWYSITMGASGATESWLASSTSGPWTKIDTTRVRSVFAQSGIAYAVGPEGLFRFDGLGVGTLPFQRKQHLALRRESDRWIVDVPSDLRGRPWMVVGADGTTLERGVAKAEALRLESSGRPAWLKIGNTATALPGL